MEKQTILLERPQVGGDGKFTGSMDISQLLPANTLARGYKLLSVTFCHDPYVIYNRFGQVVHQWDPFTIPTWLDVFNTCRDLGLT